MSEMPENVQKGLIQELQREKLADSEKKGLGVHFGGFIQMIPPKLEESLLFILLNSLKLSKIRKTLQMT